MSTYLLTLLGACIGGNMIFPNATFLQSLGIGFVVSSLWTFIDSKKG